MALRKHTAEDNVINSINYILIFLLIIVTLHPFYYVLINSLNEGLDAAMGW